jgi:hypothetical protein
MDNRIVFVAVYVALTVGMTPTLFVNVAIASSDNDPRSDRACDEMVDLEGKMDARGELDSDHPASDTGKQKSHEGAHKALGDCPLEP